MAFHNTVLLVFLSPIAIPVFLLMVLFSLLRSGLKAGLLFTIAAIHCPIAVMFNVSILVFDYNLSRFLISCRRPQIPVDFWSWDPRASVGIEAQLLVSDFFKVIAGELLLVLSTGVITFYTANRIVFYISVAVGVSAILLKWLNTSSVSKTAFSCLCDGCGLNPLMFVFSFIGLFDIGCHPIAKCAFVAKKAFLFVKEAPSQHSWFKFEENPIGLASKIEFPWNAFERGVFQLRPRIDFIRRNKGLGCDSNHYTQAGEANPETEGKYILKSFMVLKLLEKTLCEYPVERLELPEDYSKPNELYHFLVTLSKHDGFVTDKMRGRYERSLTLLEIVDGVQASSGYACMDPWDTQFVVAELVTRQASDGSSLGRGMTMRSHV